MSYPSLNEKQRFQNGDFLSAVCHELKNPLNAITAFASLLKDGIRNPKEVTECEEYAEEIETAANDLNGIVNDLLDVTAANSGNFSVNLSHEIDVNDVIKRSVKLNADYALRRKINIATAITDNIKPIKLDAKRLKQILVNLISNAIKYSPEDTEIKVETKQVTTGGGVAPGDAFTNFLQITISDQGFGMTSEQVEHLFEKYRTFENPNSGKVDSFGLGLAITKQLVELQNGRIEIRSELNKGTEVELRFPYLL